MEFRVILWYVKMQVGSYVVLVSGGGIDVSPCSFVDDYSGLASLKLYFHYCGHYRCFRAVCLCSNYHNYYYYHYFDYDCNACSCYYCCNYYDYLTDLKNYWE